mgnify:CR=1 FL=1
MYEGHGNHTLMYEIDVLRSRGNQRSMYEVRGDKRSMFEGQGEQMARMYEGSWDQGSMY